MKLTTTALNTQISSFRKKFHTNPNALYLSKDDMYEFRKSLSFEYNIDMKDVSQYSGMTIKKTTGTSKLAHEVIEIEEIVKDGKTTKKTHIITKAETELK